VAVRIVTDSMCDLPPETIKELGIIIVPMHLLFGTKSYRDGVDISTDEFYQKLLYEPVYPTTAQPVPQDFLAAFSRLSEAETDGIICIHVSAKLTGAVNSAEQAKKNTPLKVPIAIFDSQSLSLGLGLIVRTAALMAKAGKTFTEITGAVHQMITHTKVLIMFDTLEYLAKGGRIGKAKSLLGAIINIKPLIALKDGEFVPSGQVRSYAKAKERLLEFANSSTEVAEVYVAYSTTPEEAQGLVGRITACPPENIRVGRVGPVIAAHGGPGLLGLAVRHKSQPPD